MNWKTKAAIVRMFDTLPLGDRLYRVAQRRFGRLGVQPLTRLLVQVEMLKWLRKSGISGEGLRLFEVGTGHVPIVPVGFFLSGAARVITVDLNRRIEWDLTRKSLQWIATNRSRLWALYHGLVPEDIFDDRFDILQRFADAPKRFFEEAAIEYLAPMNAAASGLSEHSVDCHFSVTTLEHIPLEAIRGIFIEARRILTQDGVAIHFTDLSDHFQHQDACITQINFLRFSEIEWQRIAGNEFAYCNRLRVSDYLSLFAQLDFTVVRYETHVDQESVFTLQNKGISPHQSFSSYSLEDLCTTSLRVLLGRHDSHLSSFETDNRRKKK